jgi:osmotically-inducible protein OsmY
MKTGQVCTLSALVVLAVGCSASHQTYVTPSGQEYAAGPATTDRALEQDLRAQLRQYGQLAPKEQNIQIRANNGQVTLSGPVSSERDQAMIVAMVRNSGGVVAVNDELSVVYPPTGRIEPTPAPQVPAPVYATPPAAPNLPAPPVPAPANQMITPDGYASFRLMASTDADVTIANHIAERLRTNSVPPEWLYGLTFTVSQGNVYLRGGVDFRDYKQDIISVVQDTQGVQAVYDEMSVK